MKITKRQLRRIIKEEKARLLWEQEAPVDTREHQWPSADGPIADVAEDLSASWGKMEADAWSSGDPSMNMHGELDDAESKEWWQRLVDVATEELEEELAQRLREVAIEVMKQKTDDLINGEITA